MSYMPVSRRSKPASVRRPGKLFVLICAPILAAGGFIYIYSYNPDTHRTLFLPCLIYLFTGLYCPGCGNTRALHALTHLDILGMLDFNLLFPFLFLILFWLLLGEYLYLLLGRRILWLPNRISAIVIILAFIIVAAFTILRNVPVYPCSFLAP